MKHDTLRVSVTAEAWSLLEPFRTSHHTIDSVKVIVVTLEQGGHCGRGEAAGVYYRGETVESMLQDVERVRPNLESGFTREDLLHHLPAGGARNAIDCALWDLEAKRTDRPVWQLSGLPEPKPLTTFVTCGADTPAAMAQKAIEYEGFSSIKLKLLADTDDVQRVMRVRAARPDVQLCVDANQSFDRASLRRLLPVLERAGVTLIEQPFPRGCEQWAEEFRNGIPLMADESAETSADLKHLQGRFDIVNLKLDKSGGLTEAMNMARSARELGMGLYVGNMFGTSLAMAPAFLLGQICDFVELDGPLFLSGDQEWPLRFEQGRILSNSHLWGCPRAGSAVPPADLPG